MPEWTSSDLVSDLKKEYAIPAGQPGYSDAEIATILLRVFQDELFPDILGLREDYFVTSSDEAVATGQTDYAIPSGAAGRKLREVKLVNTADLDDQIDVPRIPFASRERFSVTGKCGFYLQAGNIVLVNGDGYTSYTMRKYYYRLIDDIEDAEIPDEFRRPIILGAIHRISMSRGDLQEAGVWQQKYAEARQRALDLISVRVDGEEENIIAGEAFA